MSATAPGRAVVDAGHKAAAIDSGLPEVWLREGVTYTQANDEHGLLSVSPTRFANPVWATASGWCRDTLTPR